MEEYPNQEMEDLGNYALDERYTKFEIEIFLLSNMKLDLFK